MKYHLKTVILIAGVVGFASSLTASQMRVHSPEASTGYQGQTASGSSLTNDPQGTWKFDVGYFSGSFDPATSDFSLWESNWNSFITAQWVTSPVFLAGKFDTSFAMNDPSFTGNQGFIWGYNQKADLGAAEWILVTDAAWVFPVVDPLSTAPTPANTWNIAQGDSFIAGTELANGFQMQAIPEPSTYALIFGLGILGFLGFRRFRK